MAWSNWATRTVPDKAVFTVFGAILIASALFISLSDKSQEFESLHAVRIRGIAQAEGFAEGIGYSTDTVQLVLDDAVARGLAKSRTGGRVHGYMLTPDGPSRHDQLVAARYAGRKRRSGGGLRSTSRSQSRVQGGNYEVSDRGRR